MDPSLSRRVWIVEDSIPQRLQGARVQSALENAGFDVSVFSLGNDMLSVSSGAPLLVVHSIYFAHRLSDHLALAARLRERNDHVHQTLVGYLPALNYSNFLKGKPSIDSIICGDAEVIVPVLVEHLRRSTECSRIPGIATRTVQGAVALNLPSAIQLDQIPTPVMDRASSQFEGCAFTTIEASRGCYHSCAFCLPTHFYRHLHLPYRLRTVNSLVDEIEAHYTRGVRLFLFDDNQFLPPGNLRYARIGQFGAELAKRRMEIAFTFKCRADDVDVALFRHLKQLGLVRVYVGIESGCQLVLDAFNKHVTIKQNLEALALLDEVGVICDFRSLLFHPLSTIDTLHAELAFLEQALPYVSTLLDFREVELYPGTPLSKYINNPDDMERSPTRYGIRDARAEVVRRCSRVLFGTSGPIPDFRERIARLWFHVLLKERFGSGELVSLEREEIQGCIRKLNSEMLAIQCELVDSLGNGPGLSADQVNARVGDWMLRVRKAALDAEELLPNLEADGDASRVSDCGLSSRLAE